MFGDDGFIWVLNERMVEGMDEIEVSFLVEALQRTYDEYSN